VAVTVGAAYYLQQPSGAGTYFVVQVVDEKFTMYVTNPEAVQLALENMEGKNSMHPQGDLDFGDGGFNKPWSWHMKPETVEMVEVSVELCDGTPSMLEANLTYWVNTVKFFCPWDSKVLSASKMNSNGTISSLFHSSPTGQFLASDRLVAEFTGYVAP